MKARASHPPAEWPTKTTLLFAEEEDCSERAVSTVSLTLSRYHEYPVCVVHELDQYERVKIIFPTLNQSLRSTGTT